MVVQAQPFQVDQVEMERKVAVVVAVALVLLMVKHLVQVVQVALVIAAFTVGNRDVRC